MAVLDLTTLPRLKRFAGVDGTRPDVDPLLLGIIAGVSAQFSNLCNVSFDVRQRTELRPFPRTGRFNFANGPAKSVSLVEYSADGTFFDGVTVQSSSYSLSYDGLYIALRDGWKGGYIRVTYLGGLFGSTAIAVASVTASGPMLAESTTLSDGRIVSVISAGVAEIGFTNVQGYFREGDSWTQSNGTVIQIVSITSQSVTNDAPDLEQAALMQCSHLWKRRMTLGRTSTDIGNGSTQWAGDYEILDDVKVLLRKYSRPFAFL